MPNEEPPLILARLREMADSNYQIVRTIQKAIADDRGLPDPKLLQQLKELSNAARLAYAQYYKLKGYESYDPAAEMDAEERKQSAAVALHRGSWKPKAEMDDGGEEAEGETG